MKLKWSLNPISLYGGDPIAALKLISRAGFDTAELWTVAEEQVEAVRIALQENDLKLSAICTDEFDLVDPEKREAYVAGVKTAIAKAKQLNCPALITQVGNDNGKGYTQHESIVAGLKQAAPLLEEAGITLLVEPLNIVKDHIGYYLSSSEEGFEIIREVDSPNVRLLFDIYHQLQMKEDVLTQIQKGLPLIAHFHVAGVPARDDKIFEGEDYTPIFRWLAQSDYAGHMGLELWPVSDEARDELYRKVKEF